MAYVVKKPLNIGGRRRVIGEILRSDEVSAVSLIRSGYVARIDSKLVETAENAGGFSGALFEQGRVNLPVLSEDGPTVISVAPESISEAVRIMQLPQADAIAALRQAENRDMLLVVSLCEGNKAILSAIRKRLGELDATATEAGGRAGED